MPALYGLKSAGAAFCNHLVDCMDIMGYKPCLAGRDLWMKAMARPDNGFKYYVCMLLYVDDVLGINHEGQSPSTSWITISR